MRDENGAKARLQTLIIVLRSKERSYFSPDSIQLFQQHHSNIFVHRKGLGQSPFMGFTIFVLRSEERSYIATAFMQWTNHDLNREGALAELTEIYEG
jgi:hypothetical protein